MKNNSRNDYTPPQLIIIELTIERGFAVSAGMSIDGFNDGGIIINII